MCIRRSVELIQRSCIKGAQGISEFKNPTQGNNKKGENQMYVEHDEFDREIYHLSTSDIESLDVASLFYELMVIEVRKCSGIIIVNDIYNVVYDEVSGRYGYCNTKLGNRVNYFGKNNALIGILTQLTK